MRILQVMPDFGLAGAETMCEQLVYQLQQHLSCEVFVASLYDHHTAITDRMEQRGIRVFYLGKSHGLDLTIIWKLNRIMVDYKINVVHTHRYVMQYAIPAALMAMVPVKVHTIHSIATQEVDAARRVLAEISYRFLKVVPVSISPQVRQTVVEEYKISPSCTPVVYNGTDLSHCMIKTDYASCPPAFRFIHVGRFSLPKNHLVLFDAVAVLKERGRQIHVDLLGTGELEESCRTQVTEKGLDDIITFHGLQPDVYPFLHQADCFLLPSLYEGMPCSIIEAMGCGLPVIAAHVGGIPDMISHEQDGLLIPPTTSALVDAMERVMDNVSLREQIGRNAIQKAALFSAENMCNGYLDIYRDAMKGKHRWE